MAHQSSNAENEEFVSKPMLTWLSDCLEVITKHKLLDELVVCTPKYSDVLKKGDNQLLAGNVSKWKLGRTDEIEEQMRQLQEQSDKFALENAAMRAKMAELDAIDDELEQKIVQFKASTSFLESNHSSWYQYPNPSVDICDETLSCTNSSSIEILNYETEMIEHLEQTKADLTAKVARLEKELAKANREKLQLREEDTRETSDDDKKAAKAKASTRDRRSARFQTLKQDHELLKEDFATLMTTYDEIKSLNEDQRAKNERIIELEMQKRELEEKCKKLVQLKANNESHILELLEMLSRMKKENHELFAQNLENRQCNHEQQRKLEKHRSATNVTKITFGKRAGSVFSGGSSTESEDFEFSESESEVGSPTMGESFNFMNGLELRNQTLV